MTLDYTAEQVPATPEYVLAVLDTAFRMFGELKRVDYKPIPLTFEMAVAAWLKRFGFSRSVFQMEGAEWLNSLFELDLPDDEWDQFLFRDDRFTLGDLCRFVASHLGMREVIRPWRSLVGECQAAGAFLTLKS
ncbi:MAG TPA: hypothetical protein VG122_19595 [Gemmata sp.]|jgi:hypothetical protein|nr:hypothetical protein [Gemmata sp.]